MTTDTIQIQSELGTQNTSDPYYGVSLAVLSSIFIGASFILKKISLQLNPSEDGDYNYLLDKLWWYGLLLVSLGEVAKFAAYGFAPVALVVPLGALSVLVYIIVASNYVDEEINEIRLLGCCLYILGATVMCAHAPKEEDINSIEELSARIRHSGFHIYMAIITVIRLIVFCYMGPVSGKAYMMVHLSFCSAVGSLAVMACKGISVAIRYGIGSGINSYELLAVALILLVTFSISLQMNYINTKFEILSIETIIYYALFTSSVLLAAGNLFDEWKNLSGGDIVSFLCGFLTTVLGIYMVHSYEDIEGMFEENYSRLSLNRG